MSAPTHPEWNLAFKANLTSLQQGFNNTIAALRTDAVGAVHAVAATLDDGATLFPDELLAKMAPAYLLFSVRPDAATRKDLVRVTLGDLEADPEKDYDLFDVFLSGFADAERRQYHACSTCRQFFHLYGWLILVDPKTGDSVPALWDESLVDEVYREPVRRVARLVRRQTIVTPVVPTGNILGLAQTVTHYGAIDIETSAMPGQTLVAEPAVARVDHVHDHYCVHLPGQAATAPTTKAGRKLLEELGELQTSAGAAAEIWNIHTTLSGAFAELLTAPKVLHTALELLRSGHLYRPGSYTTMVAWLLQWTERLAACKSPLFRDNLVWLAAATCPSDAFWHFRDGMVGKLLGDLRSGKETWRVIRNFNALAGNIDFRRPQTPASAELIAKANAAFKELGLVTALKRRLANLEDLTLDWAPVAPAVATAPVSDDPFAHLIPKEAKAKAETAKVAGPADVVLEPTVMTWAKFTSTVLPSLVSLELKIAQNAYLPFTTYTTAADPTAGPLLAWDHPEARNPVGTFNVHTGPSTQSAQALPRDFGLAVGQWIKVTGIAGQPAHWGGKAAAFPQFIPFATLLLEGARLVAVPEGIGLFPSTLRGDLHEYERVIEQFSSNARFTDDERAAATGSGLTIIPGGVYGRLILLRGVTRQGMTHQVYIDRWD